MTEIIEQAVRDLRAIASIMLIGSIVACIAFFSVVAFVLVLAASVRGDIHPGFLVPFAMVAAASWIFAESWRRS